MKLVEAFAWNWLYWLIAWLIGDQFFFDKEHTWVYHVFHATWMAFFMTVIFKWKDVKQAFKPRNSRSQHTQS